MTATIDHGVPEVWKKYKVYDLNVDPKQEDRALELQLCSFSRPHMRAFHCSWLGFFIAFFVWFAITPLLSEVGETLNLTNKEIWTSSIASVGGTILARFIIGPLCDKVGARTLYTVLLCTSAVPTACTGLVQTASGLTVLRLFIGVAGAVFVTCQYWTSCLFTKEVVGTANALVAGWGNLGAGVTHLVIGSALFPLFKRISDDDAEKAWRTVCIVPAVVAFGIGIMIYYVSDDAPKGNYSELKKHGQMPEVSLIESFRSGAYNLNSWVLALQYACCFGVELTMNSATGLYFRDQFDLAPEEASAIAAIFGWMNLFARAIGGFVSDDLNAKFGMRGRLWAQTVCLLAEGALVLVFANTQSLASAIATMVFFSLFVQAAEGTSYGIVPYVDPPYTGSVSGIVGAGGNIGAVCFGLGFRNSASYTYAFNLMGYCILASALTSLFIFIEGENSLLSGEKYKSTPVAKSRRPRRTDSKGDIFNESPTQVA